MLRTRPACPASKAFPLAADSSSASSTVPASRNWPSVRPVVATRRCSAARIRAEVNNSDPATRVDARTVGPTQHPRLADVLVSPCQGDRSGLQHLGEEQLHQLVNFVGGNLRRPDVALRFGADMPALPGRTVFLHRGQHLLRGRRHPLRVHGRAPRGAGVEGVGDHGLDRVRSAERLGGLGIPGRRAARSECEVRAWRPESPKWPAAPTATPPPASAADHDHAETGPPVHLAGP